MTRGRGAVVYTCRRSHRGAPPAEFAVAYRPIGPVLPSTPGTLVHWLTERYCLYAVTRSGRLRRAEIHHPVWPLQCADAEIRSNTMTGGLGFQLPDSEPVVHFAERLDVHVWPPEALRLDLQRWRSVSRNRSPSGRGRTASSRWARPA